MFSMMPAPIKNFSEQGQKMWNDFTSQFNGFGKNIFESTQNSWNNMFPAANANSFFASMNDNYSKMQNYMQNASSPLMKMMSDGTQKEMFEATSTISDLFARFSMSNTQLQYMTYTAGLKASETTAKNLYEKMSKGEDMSSMTGLYNEWLSVNDKIFVELFETDEYSKIQAELSSTGMKLKQQMDKQMEKMLVNVPVVPRSEMDELYKTVYELKKRVRDLEKQNELLTEVKNTVAEKPTAETKSTVETKTTSKKK